MYLRTIFELEEEGIVALRARIAERLGHSGPTVSQTVARMARAGLLVVNGDRHLELPDDGHDEACRWEHVMSERVERKLLEILDHPTESPYGNPIPGLAELGVAGDGERFRDGLRQLTDVADVAGCEVVVRRIGEPAQGDPEVLGELERAGLRPGQRVQVRRVGGAVQVSGPLAQAASVSEAVAEHVYVAVA